MLNSLDERLDRIEAALASNAEMLGELLKRKRAPAQKRQSKAQVHDAAVADADARNLASPQWTRAWNHWCARRREDKQYMTELAIKGALNKLSKFSVVAQIEALQAAAVKPWADIYPKE